MTSTATTWRHQVEDADQQKVYDMVVGTGFFNAAECDIAVELVEENLRRGATASGYHFWFLEQAGALLGYTCYGHIDGTAASYDLYWIVVAQAQQGRGYGRQLLQHTETSIHNQGGQQVYIETSEKPLYVPTRSFYLSNGYQQVALLPNFYAAGDGKLIYCKQL